MKGSGSEEWAEEESELWFTSNTASIYPWRKSSVKAKHLSCPTFIWTSQNFVFLRRINFERSSISHVAEANPKGVDSWGNKGIWAAHPNVSHHILLCASYLFRKQLLQYSSGPPLLGKALKSLWGKLQYTPQYVFSRPQLILIFLPLIPNLTPSNPELPSLLSSRPF